jgi:hypothetical protein
MPIMFWPTAQESLILLFINACSAAIGVAYVVRTPWRESVGLRLILVPGAYALTATAGVGLVTFICVLFNGEGVPQAVGYAIGGACYLGAILSFVGLPGAVLGGIAGAVFRRRHPPRPPSTPLDFSPL